MRDQPKSTELAALSRAGNYRREVAASLARVWENVFDWEHLPELHAGSFASIELLEESATGWRVRLVNQPGGRSAPQVLALVADREAGRYVVTTQEGPGAGSEIRTRLTASEFHRTKVAVEFHVPEHRPERLAAIGARYEESYARLWDEDEAMMIAREAALTHRASPRAADGPLQLGPVETLRTRLPLTVDWGSERFRLIALGDEIIVHGAICTHWFAPLDDASVVDGIIRCPWHGYRFDARTGRSVDGRTSRLGVAPRLVVEDGLASLHPAW